MKGVRGILDSKGHGVHTIAPSDNVLTALDAMAKHNVGALVVVADDAVIGLVSERHYARRLSSRGSSRTIEQLQHYITGNT